MRLAHDELEFLAAWAREERELACYQLPAHRLQLEHGVTGGELAMFINAWARVEGKKDQDVLDAVESPQARWPWPTADYYRDRFREVIRSRAEQHWDDPRNMSSHFFFQALRLDYGSAVRADTSKQDFCCFPRHWYIDATFLCERCREEFCFTAAEQKTWYEVYRFYVDSLPKGCGVCRRELRRLKSLRQEYDRAIAGALTSKDLAVKAHVATLVDHLCEAGVSLQEKVHANRALLAKQIARLRRSSEA